MNVIVGESSHGSSACLSSCGEYVCDESKYILMCLASTDVKDTSLNVQIKQASYVLIADL